MLKSLNLLKISPPFSNKIKSKEKIALVENDGIISSDTEATKIFQNFFSSFVKNLNTQRDETHLSKTTQGNPVLVCIEKFSKHAIIISIKKRIETLLFQNALKKADITTVFKRAIFAKLIKDLSAICRLYQKFMNDVYTIR